MVTNRKHRYPLIPLRTQQSCSCLPGVPHGITEDINYNGKFIPKGTIVMPSLVTLNRDSDRYNNPDTFDPTRFLEDPIDAYASALQQITCFAITFTTALAVVSARVSSSLRILFSSSFPGSYGHSTSTNSLSNPSACLTRSVCFHCRPWSQKTRSPDSNVIRSFYRSAQTVRDVYHLPGRSCPNCHSDGDFAKRGEH